VSARELEHRLAAAGASTDLSDDARTIREETDRCRRVLEEMAGQAGQPRGAAPRSMSVADVVSAMSARLSPVDRARLDTSGVQTLPVVWPLDVVTRALGNVVHNACQASAESTRVIVAAAATGEASVALTVVDHGRGMAIDTIARAGEPVFTTKPAG